MSAAAAVIVVTPDELRELVRDAVRAELDAREAQESGGEYLDAAATAKLLKVNRRTVTKLVSNGTLPAARLGRLYRFRRSDVLAVLGKRNMDPR